MGYLEQFPDGKASSTTTRGMLDLTVFSHTHGRKTSKVEHSQKPTWDYALYVSHMRVARQWNPERADLEWKRLDADPATFADEKGPADRPKRLTIPSWLVGGDYADSEDEQFEERSVRTTMKERKNMACDQKEQLLSEMQAGFTRVQPTGLATGGQFTPLPVGALTFEGGGAGDQVSGLSILGAAHHNCRGDSGGGDEPASPTRTAASSVNMSPSSPKRATFDSRSARNAVLHTTSKELSVM